MLPCVVNWKLCLEREEENDNIHVLFSLIYGDLGSPMPEGLGKLGVYDVVVE